MAVPAGLCSPWVDAADVLSDDELSQLTDEQADDVAMFASEVLYVRSNKYWPGVCSRIVRPDLGERRLWWRDGTTPWTDLPWWVGYEAPYSARWFHCDHRHLHRFNLPGPVDSVDSVTIDGVTLDPDAYVVGGRNTLIRVDGEPWPRGQDLTRQPTDPAVAGRAPAWQVAYQWGAAPPRTGMLVCASLLHELVAAVTGCRDCRLPWAGAVATVQKGGATVSYASLLDKIPQGYVGLADVDLWLDNVRGGPWRPRRPRIIRADARPRHGLSSWPA